MNGNELLKMLGSANNLRDYKVVTKDGRSVTGVWVDHENKKVIMVHKDIQVENS